MPKIVQLCSLRHGFAGLDDEGGVFLVEVEFPRSAGSIVTRATYVPQKTFDGTIANAVSALVPEAK